MFIVCRGARNFAKLESIFLCTSAFFLGGLGPVEEFRFSCLSYVCLWSPSRFAFCVTGGFRGGLKMVFI